MKKAVHDALGYLWVKNSIEADKKRKEDIAHENSKIRFVISEKRDYELGVNWWHTTELGYLGTSPDEFPFELRWYPKDVFIAAVKKDPRVSPYGGFWWNPKFGNMEDYFDEKELKIIRNSIAFMFLQRQHLDYPRLPLDKQDEHITEIIRGVMPRTEFDD